MSEATPGLVDIVRDFLACDRGLRRVVERYRRGEMLFDEVAELVRDDELSALFRLKERCHSLFRPGPESPRVSKLGEVLFDLAVGSLFHEAMKLRENFYQREVYGPRLRALREEAGPEAEALLREFEKIQSAAEERLDEGLHETEELLARTREQLLALLVEHRTDGPVSRYLVEHAPAVEAAFGEPLDALLEEIHGGASRAYVFVGGSYLESGYYAEAVQAYGAAVARGGQPDEIEPRVAYARGMAAYLEGRYADTVSELDRWIAADDPLEPGLVELAHAAISKIDRLVAEPERERLVPAAVALAERIAARRPAAAAR